jgi:hypothetical protein
MSLWEKIIRLFQGNPRAEHPINAKAISKKPVVPNIHEKQSNVKKKARGSIKPSDSIARLGEASLSPNGFVRERALDVMAQKASPEALPHILLRLSDWVPEVRQAAQVALKVVFPTLTVKMFVENRHLLDRLSRVIRVDMTAIQNDIKKELLHPSRAAELESGLFSNDVHERLFCYHYLHDSLPRRPDLVEKAVCDVDPKVSLWALRFLLDHSMEKTLDYYRLFLQGRHARIKTYLLRYASQEIIRELGPEIQELIFDNTRSVRYSSRFVLGLNTSADCRLLYRAKLADATAQTIQPGILAGLGETGIEEDMFLVQPWLENPRATIRFAAVGASIRLDWNQGRLALAHLGDSNGKIRGIATDSIQSRLTPELQQRVEVLLETGAIQEKRSSLKILSQLGGWHSLPYALNSLLQDDERLVEIAWSCLWRWDRCYYTQGWIVVSEKEKQGIAQALQMAIDYGIKINPKFESLWNRLCSAVKEWGIAGSTIQE